MQAGPCSPPACGQVNTVWPSPASGRLHSMNDKAPTFGLRCVALKIRTGFKAAFEHITVSQDVIYNEKLLLVLCVGSRASLLWL